MQDNFFTEEQNKIFANTRKDKGAIIGTQGVDDMGMQPIRDEDGRIVGCVGTSGSKIAFPTKDETIKIMQYYSDKYKLSFTEDVLEEIYSKSLLLMENGFFTTNEISHIFEKLSRIKDLKNSDIYATVERIITDFKTKTAEKVFDVSPPDIDIMDLLNEVKRLKAENRLLNDVLKDAVTKAVNDKKETTLLCTIGSSENEDGNRYGLKLLDSGEVMLDIRTLPRGLKLEVSVKQIV